MPAPSSSLLNSAQVFMRKDRKVFGQPWRDFVTNSLLEYHIPPKVVNAGITTPLIDRISRVRAWEATGVCCRCVHPLLGAAGISASHVRQ